MTVLTSIGKAASPGPRRLAGRRRPVRETVFLIALQLSLVVAIAFLAVLLAYVISKGWARLDPRLWENMPSIRRPENAGAQSAIVGTIYLMGLTALFVIPTGVLAAIYLEEYADRNKWYNRLLELNIQNLAGIPSIVYGILGLGIIARVIGLGFGLITGALTLALLVLPVVIISAREAIRAVPPSIREGSLALGATQWQTIYRQVLPSSIPGIATGSILALSRAIGEAAPLVMLGAATFVAFNPESLTDGFTALPLQIYNWIGQSRPEFGVLASSAIVILLALLLVMNSVAILLRNRYQKRW
ncbi:phosphate ABC transporter permease PtsA [Spongiactinospora rosea]|uniref:Phosphate transport system permease protein PstA n=1 Tax=Spongiactinospora rosea TaxID=2248750 RepID=A0A366LPX4_9ACTN|nr:phosphate ABC transporter permease PstA [Spongiactinospora rosea]RBQ15374.1 phosphate ABC transporter permease PtsA [Spongiactinospora rosea]